MDSKRRLLSNSKSNEILEEKHNDYGTIINIKDVNDFEVINSDVRDIENTHLIKSTDHLHKLSIFNPVTRGISIAKKGKEKVDERRSFERKYWATTIFTMLAFVSVPVAVYIVTYYLVGKPRNTLHANTERLLNQTSAEFDSLCDSSFVDWLCKQRVAEFTSKVNFNHDSYFYFGFPRRIWPKADYLVHQCQKLTSLLMETNAPYLYSEILPPTIAAGIATIFLIVLLYEFINQCLITKNQSYENSLAQLNTIDNCTQDPNELQFLNEIAADLNIPNNIITSESLLKKLDEVKTIYLRQLYFWAGTKDKLPSDLQQKIFKLMDPIPETVINRCKR